MTTAQSAASAIDRDDLAADAARPRPARGSGPDAGKSGQAPPAAPPAEYEAAVRHWLEWQCGMISGVHRGVVFVMSTARTDLLDSAVFWPEEGGSTSIMRNVAAKALRVGRGIVQKAPETDDLRAEICDYIAYPVVHEGRLAGVVVLAIEIRSEVQRQAVLQLVEWGAVWLENVLGDLRGQNRTAGALALTAIADLASDVPVPLAAHKLCTLLADSLDCSKVVLGLVAGMQVQLVAVSHQLQFDRRRASLARLEAAMEECVDQGQPLSLPIEVASAGSLTHAHARLLEESGQAGVFSVPLEADGEIFGALTLMWDAAKAFDRKAGRLAVEVVRRVAPVLYLRRRESRPLRHRLFGGMNSAAGRLFGAGYLRLKLGVAALLIALGLAVTIQTDYRIAARSMIEGTVQQAVVAPVAGYLLSAGARAGDQVESGQVLAVLDDRELLLERDKWRSEREKHAKEYQEALAGRDRAKISIASARIAQAEAQFKLVEEQLERLQVKAPFSGTLVSGDLSRALGAPVERGQLLFEIVPAGSYRVSLQVDEHDVAGVEAGQVGTLRLTGLPNAAIPLEITQLIPVATAEQGANNYRVEAELKETPDGLRPGMQGVAKVVVARGSLLWSWTHELVARLRLWLWSTGL
jgi:multidrug efflux pump subunit AcrA (membrane-fusion protein)